MFGGDSYSANTFEYHFIIIDWNYGKPNMLQSEMVTLKQQNR